MTLSCDYGLLFGKDVAYLTLLTVGKTSFGTSCCFSGNNNLGVTLSRDYGLLFGKDVAYRTLLTVGKTGFGTGCCIAGYCILDVSLSRNNLLRDKYGVTYGAMSACGKTGFGTGCINCRVGNDVVTESCVGINYLILLAASVVTDSGLGAVAFAGCVAVGYVVSKAVSGCGALVCYGVGIAAASVTGSSLSAVLLTGSVVVGYVVSEDVTLYRALVGNGVLLAASVVTGSGLGAVCGAGCVAVGYVVGEGVTGCGADVCYGIACAASVVTHSGLSAVGGTGRVAVGYVISKGVSKHSALSLNGVGYAASVITDSGLSAVSGAGCVAVVNVLGKAMLTGNSYVATDITGCVLAVRVGMLTLNDKRTKNLSRDVLVTANACACDINVDNVVILCRVVEGVKRGDCRDKTEYVVNVNVLAAKGDNLVDNSVDVRAVCNGYLCKKRGGKSVKSGGQLVRHYCACGIAECADNVCKSECYLIYEELVVEVVAVIVTKCRNGRLGVDCNDGLHGLCVSNIVGDELVECGAYCYVENLCYGKLNGVKRVLSKL